MPPVVDAGESSIAVEPQTARSSFAFRGETVAQAARAPRFRLAGRDAEVRKVEAADGGIEVLLEGQDVRGRWKLLPGDGAVRSSLQIEGAPGDEAVDIEIPFPLSAAVELPVDQRWGARIDSSCPAGAENGVPLSGMKNQLAAVEAGGAALAFIGLADYTRHLPGTYGTVWKEGAFRDGDSLWLHLQTLNGLPFQMSCHADLDGVIDRYCRVLRENLGVLTIEEDGATPAWLDEVRVFAVFEMWRSDGEVLNDFGHVASFCRDLKDFGVKGGVVVRLVGFQGRFDSRYPYFDPPEKLGGAAGMRRAADAVHAGGNRLMAHFNIWGLDPYLEDFEELEHLAVPYDRAYERIPTGQIGPYDGWPGPYPAVATGFDSGQLPLNPAEEDDSHVTFETCDIPEPVEAYLTVSGVRALASGGLRAEVDERRVKSPRGGFERTETVRFHFRFRFAPGVNRVRLDFLGGRPDLSEATYRIDGAVRAGKVWSYPIIRGDIHNPEWIQLTRDNMVRVSREYAVDIPYIDCINVWRDEDRPIFDAIREDLSGRAFACEYSAELGYNMFRLTGTGVECVPTREEKGYRVSDFSRRVHERYTRFFTPGYAYVPYGGPSWHAGQLCAAEGERREYAERHLREGAQWGVFPAVRLNYRDCGLDERAREIILEACERGRR